MQRFVKGWLVSKFVKASMCKSALYFQSAGRAAPTAGLTVIASPLPRSKLQAHCLCGGHGCPTGSLHSLDVLAGGAIAKERFSHVGFSGRVIL